MKKINLILLCLLMLPLFLHAQASSCDIMGDVNEDSEVDIVDALLIAQAYVGLNPTIEYHPCADVNCSGSVDIVDALLIAQKYVGLISEFSCQNTPEPTIEPTSAPVLNIACGSSSALGIFQEDQYYSGGSTHNNSNTIDVSRITVNTPPTGLFNNERYGEMSYTIPDLSAGDTYTVTLYFAETYLTSPGSRLFNVSINSTEVLTNFDIYAAAGGQNNGISQSFITTANTSGRIVIDFTAVTENPKINGISIVTGIGPTNIPTPEPTPTPENSGFQRGPDPSLESISANRGTFATAELTFPAGNGFGGGFIYYPTDTSLGTWAAVAICPGGSAKFANEETWMGHWLASFGFVVIGMETNNTYDYPESRGTQLLAALDYLTQKSAVKDRVDPDRLMVMGHSMGGGGAFHAAMARSSLKTMVALAPWFNSSLTSPSMTNLHMPAMIISARNDTVVTPASCSAIYDKIPTTTQRAWVELAADDHLGFTKSNPTEMRVLIPWMKIFLDNDERYVQFLCPIANSSNISVYKNSCPFVP
ncbi:MAG: alpha/beta hydrolase fold domain-containing protein [Syntrophaceae bacterium]|nr:alpha/beta hydrolase fold domain-containing protein [Syntrophaceae bacterium]